MEERVLEFTTIETRELTRLRQAAADQAHWINVTDHTPEKSEPVFVLVQIGAALAPAVAWYQPRSPRKWVNIWDTTLDMTGVVCWAPMSALAPAGTK